MTNTVGYAIATMVHIAAHRGGGPLSSRAIAAAIDASPKYLLHVLSQLVSADLVHGTRGVSGGYELAKPASKISVIEIVEAISGPLDQTDLSLNGLTPMSRKFLIGALADITEGARQRLRAITLDMLKATKA